MTTTDVVVVGGGPGGYVAAIRCAQLGRRTTLIEAADLGGVCLNEGCVPSKALIHDATDLANQRSRGEWTDATSLANRLVDLAQHRWGIVGTLRDGIAGLLKANRITVVRGVGRFTGRHTIDVTTADGVTALTFDTAIVATGSEVIVPRGIGVDGTFVVTSREVLALDHLPARSVVVGGGYVGLELASALHDLGSQVIVVEAQDHVLGSIPRELGDHVREQLVKRGLDLRTSTSVVGVERPTVVVSSAGATQRLETDLVVVAVGRRPRTADLGLEALGVAVTPTGHVEVDETLQTTTPGIFAIGDITPGPALAHRAMAQGRVAAEVACGRRRRFDPAAVPAVVFTTPEVATVGWSLEEARTAGVDAQQTRFPLAANARSLTLGQGGFGILVHETATGRVLGLHLAGPSAGELIGIGALALEMGATVEDLGATIWPHPTLSEMVGELGEAAGGHPVHISPIGRRSAH